MDTLHQGVMRRIRQGDIACSRAADEEHPRFAFALADIAEPYAIGQGPDPAFFVTPLPPGVEFS
jgi:hypothetical protein